jgi:hypothetical protein
MEREPQSPTLQSMAMRLAEFRRVGAGRDLHIVDSKGRVITADGMLPALASLVLRAAVAQ